MAEKIIPDVQEFLDEIKTELSLDFTKQRAAMLKRILSTPPERFHEVHLEEWYNQFWKLAGITAQINQLADVEEEFCKKLFAEGTAVDNVRRQYYALSLILLGKLDEAKTLIDTKLWSKYLRDNFATFESWRQIIIGGLDPLRRARLARDRAIKKFLTEKYSYVIERHAKTVINNKNCPKVAPKDYQIFYGWLQGEENLPLLARCCYNSLKMNAGAYKITFIDEKNYSDYVDIPPYIYEKFKAGKMKPAHFTDVIRINLLERYGGLWLDATIFVTSSIPEIIFNLPFFTIKYHVNANHRNVSLGRWTAFLLASQAGNILPQFVLEFMSEYWRVKDLLIDYALFDYSIATAYNELPECRNLIDAVPQSNPDLRKLNGLLNSEFNQDKFNKLTLSTQFFKLTYKQKFNKLINNRKTFYAHVLESYK